MVPIHLENCDTPNLGRGIQRAVLTLTVPTMQPQDNFLPIIYFTSSHQMETHGFGIIVAMP